jgi:hypothetical protein
VYGSASKEISNSDCPSVLAILSRKSYLLIVLGRKVRNSICISPVELATVGLCGIPFHGILRCDGTKLGAADDVLLGVVIADSQRSTNVGATARFDGSIERCCCLLARV